MLPWRVREGCDERNQGPGERARPFPPPVTATIRPLAGHIGAEMAGLDLRHIGPTEAAAIRAALIEHQVLFFPRQGLSADELARAATAFGTIDPPHRGLERHPDNPDVMLAVSRGGEGGAKYNDIWHSDVSFDRTPPMASLLQAVTLPPTGGDTLFASMSTAWEALSERLRRALRGLLALHDGIPNFTPYLLDPGTPDGPARLEKLKREQPGFAHPLVIRHPESGREALFVNRAYTQRILGLSEIESRRLLDLLCEHCEQASFQTRWRWSEGDIAFWDNRCTLHYAARDYGRHDRLMIRVTLKGTQPVAA